MIQFPCSYDNLIMLKFYFFSPLVYFNSNNNLVFLYIVLICIDFIKVLQITIIMGHHLDLDLYTLLVTCNHISVVGSLVLLWALLDLLVDQVVDFLIGEQIKKETFEETMTGDHRLQIHSSALNLWTHWVLWLMKRYFPLYIDFSLWAYMYSKNITAPCIVLFNNVLSGLILYKVSHSDRKDILDIQGRLSEHFVCSILVLELAVSSQYCKWYSERLAVLYFCSQEVLSLHILKID